MWTTKFLQDTDTPGVGTVVVVSPDATFFLSERVDTNDAKEVAAFVEKVRSEFSSRDKTKVDAESIAASISKQLNEV